MKKVIFVFIFLLLVYPLFSREITIFVNDHDLDIPLEGAIIRTRDGTDYRCDANGKAVFPAPEDRQIIVQIIYPGYETGVLVIPVSDDTFSVSLVLSGVLQGRELVVEASRPGSNETRTGRSVSVSSREISQTAEIGVIEDVMNTIKLLPGVNYSGTFNAQPSIRGGHPGDMSASLDGFYIKNPYFWSGAFSIFDPRMVQSAQLSHGVFSSRYGHTISGLLEITTKDPSPAETQFELGLNTSAANFNLSVPLIKGGILFMGRVTYYDPIIELAKSLSGYIPELEAINFIRKAPFIRTATISGNYRFTDNLELSSTGFFGMDGVSAYFLNSSETILLNSETSVDISFTNYQGFFTSSLSWNPQNNKLLKLSLGTGYEEMVINGIMDYKIHNKEFSQVFKTKYSHPFINYITANPYQLYDHSLIVQNDILFNIQGRLDFDWELSENLLLSAGIQEMFNQYKSIGDQKVTNEIRFIYLPNEEQDYIKNTYPFILLPSNSIIWNDLRISVPIHYSPFIKNNLFSTSGYILSEYSSINNRFKTEAGVRVDHFYLQGNSFSLSSVPVINPRINMDFNILKNKNILRSFDISAGSGLFSSINDNVFSAEERYNIDQIKPNRSWTSILGLNFEFPDSLSFNIEGYYKYIFDRMYIPMILNLDDLDISPNFDGEGMVWGLDLLLHKVQSRFWDGWLSYSYNWTKYRDPKGRFGVRGISGGNRGDDWYFPPFHRFHNLNLVFNYKPVNRINIFLRLGFASGVQLARRLGNAPDAFPVLIYDKENITNSYLIEKYYWPSVFDENNRTTPSLPMDLKFSFYGGNKDGKTRYEIYVALENVLAFAYTSQGNTSFNQYTGQVDTSSTSANYEIPMPIPSFGVKFSY